MLSVIVLNWNQRDLTDRCVRSVREHTDVDYELIVVDNGSDPPIADWARSVADQAVLNDSNLGFAPGMNAGLNVARGSHVVFANNDTVFPGHWASRLLETFASTPRAGIVLPAVTAAGNPFAVRDTPGTDRVVAPPFQHLPSGVVYLADTDDMRSLGGWDERYRLAGREDLDLLFMMWSNDRQVVLDERVLVEHEASATLNEQPAAKQDLRNENWERFIERWSVASDIPRLSDLDDTTCATRLREARTAAFWMERWMQERQRYYAKNREWKSEAKHRRVAEDKLAKLQGGKRSRRGRR